MGIPSTPATLYQRATRAVRITSSQTTAQLAELRRGLSCAERLLEAEQASAVVSPGVPAVASLDLFLQALKDEEASLNVLGSVAPDLWGSLALRRSASLTLWGSGALTLWRSRALELCRSGSLGIRRSALGPWGSDAPTREKRAAVTKRLRLMSTELRGQSTGLASSTAEPDRDAEEVDSEDAVQGLQDLLSVALS